VHNNQFLKGNVKFQTIAFQYNLTSQTTKTFQFTKSKFVTKVKIVYALTRQ